MLLHMFRKHQCSFEFLVSMYLKQVREMGYFYRRFVEESFMGETRTMAQKAPQDPSPQPSKADSSGDEFTFLNRLGQQILRQCKLKSSEYPNPLILASKNYVSRFEPKEIFAHVLYAEPPNP